MIFHRKMTEPLRQAIALATVRAEDISAVADVAAEHGELSMTAAHQLRMITRHLQEVEDRMRRFADIDLADEPNVYLERGAA